MPRIKQTAVVWVVCAIVATTTAARRPVAVFTAQYDNNRTGSNPLETVLTPGNVNSKQFGKLFSRAVDDTVYALPLILPQMRIAPNEPARTLMIVATMNNTVYAFDAVEASRSAPYWKKNLGRPGVGDSWIGPVNHGILSTPVYDPATGTIYVVAKIRSEMESALWVHALDVMTGELKYNSPVRVTFPFADGTLVTNVPGSIQRPGLLLWDNVLYVAFANILVQPKSEYLTQEGFAQSFDARNLTRRLGNFQSTPTGMKGGIWHAGRGLAADKGGVYLATGGGSYDGARNFGSSYLRLSHRTLTPVDWLTPANHETLFHGNLDPSANGVTLIPGTNLGFAGGKDGIIYLFDRTKMGRLETGDSPVLQKFLASNGCGESSCTQTLGTAFWSGSGESRLFVWDRTDALRAYVYRNGRFDTKPQSVSKIRTEMTGGPSVSSSGTDLQSAIVWAVTVNQNANGSQVPATLRAFRGADVSDELYHSGENPQRDAVGNFTKFAPPVVANGMVYVPTHSNAVHVYGLLK